MKIALYHNLTSGGSKREAHELARQCVAHGHTVHIFAPTTADENFLPSASVAQKVFTYPLTLHPPLNQRLPFLREYVDLGRLLANLRRLAQLARRVASEIDAGQYEVVFVHHDQLVQSPYLLRFLQTPSAYYCAEPMREFYEPAIPRPYLQPSSRAVRWQRAWYTPVRWLRRQLLKALDRRNVAHATRLLTNSYFSVEALYRAYGLRAAVVYLGVDGEKFRPVGLPRENFVLTVGAIVPHKGYDFLIAALGQLPPSLRPALIIIGNTAAAPETQFLRQLAAQQQVTLEFKVNVSDAELAQLYSTARALVYAPVLEPFGFAPLEAMAASTPIVAVKEGGVRESVRENETGLLAPREPAAFAAALTRVLTEPTLAAQLGAQGRAWVEQFWTWPLAYARLMHQLQGLVA